MELIPKKIHYCWFGGGELPEKDKKNIEGWKKLCPDYEIICWNESNYDINKNDYMKEAYSLKKWGFVPDYARTDIIYTHGGFYFDTDVELLKPLDQFLNEKCVMGFEKKDSINHGHGFAAEKGNEIIKELLDFYESIHFINEDNSINLTASPKYITNLLLRHNLKLNNKEQILDNVVHIYPTDYFCPKDYMTGKIEISTNTISIHHFNLSWMSTEQRKKMEKIGKWSKFCGEFWARNFFEIGEMFKKDGIFGTFKLLKRKIINKFKRKEK